APVTPRAPTFAPPPASSSASRSGSSWAAAPAGRGSEPARDGEIPIAIPIPFTSAAAPTAGMLRRIQEATPGDPLDPAVIQALLALSRDVIERVAWEGVPDLAEEIIRKQAAKQLQSASPAPGMPRDRGRDRGSTRRKGSCRAARQTRSTTAASWYRDAA